MFIDFFVAIVFTFTIIIALQDSCINRAIFLDVNMCSYFY